MTTLRGERVTLRPWVDADLAPFAAMNADAQVMRYMSKPLTRAESDAYAARIRAQIDTHGHGLWALDVPAIGFAGFVGLTPTVPFELNHPGLWPDPHEIGWRLAPAAWGRGFATEAARLALSHAHEGLGWPQVVSFTALPNTPSQAVMQRIGMTRRGEFEHPKLEPGHPMRRHVLYAHDAATSAPSPGGSTSPSPSASTSGVAPP